MTTWEAVLAILGLARDHGAHARRSSCSPSASCRCRAGCSGLRYAPLAALAAVVVPEIVMTQGELIATWQDARLFAVAAASAWYFWRRGILGTIVSGSAVMLALRLGWAGEAARRSSDVARLLESPHERPPLLRPRRAGPGRRPARLHPRRPQRAAGRRRPHHRGHPHPRLGALHPHGAGRRRRGDGHLAPGPPDRRRVQAAKTRSRRWRSAWPSCSAARCRCAATGSTASSRSPAQVVLLENCRVNKGEKKNDEALARKMAALCDIFVHDAFGTAHRAEATHLRHRAVRARSPAPARCWRPRSTPSRKALAQPKRPLVAIVAGSKVSTKLTILQGAGGQGRRARSSAAASPTPSCSPPACRSASRWPSPTCVGEAKAVIDAMKARGAAVPIPRRRGGGEGLHGRRAGHREGRRRRGRRRPDPRHRPARPRRCWPTS